MKITFGGKQSRRSGRPTGKAGKIALTLFLSIFIVAGLLVSVVIVDDAQRRTDQQGWVKVSCEVLTSEVVIDASSNEPYSPRVTYRYRYGETDYTGKVAVDGGFSSGDYTDAQEVVLAYPAGEKREALVNPDNPSEAVLRPRPIGESLLMLLFPLMFIGVPVAILVGVWWPRGGRAGKAEALSDKAASKQMGPVGLLIFGAIFLAAGAGVGVPISVLPTMRTLKAESWTQVPCVIERSAVLTFEDSDDGDTYKVDILYRYEFDGRTYRSNRFSFRSIGSSSGYSGKAKTVREHPVGSEHVCFVNPGDPAQATLKRGWGLGNLFALFPIPFVLAGLAMMYVGVKRLVVPQEAGWSSGASTRSIANRKRRRGGGSRIDAGRSVDAGPVVLKPGMSRLGKSAGLLFFALFWNGILSVFVYQAAQGWMTGDVDVCLTVFMVPFVMVGLVVVAAFFQSLLVIVAPAVVLTLDRRAIPLGGATTLRWSVAGRPGRLHGLTISLVGTESATYRRGTNTVTDTHDFYTEHLVGGDLAEQGEADPLALPVDSDRGELTLRVPADTMHSFKSSNNKVTWTLRVRAWVPRWPDPKDQYEVRILPMQVVDA
ncbi:MAG: DUF3592 domain-containing protein [Planctomycetota bacterium]